MARSRRERALDAERQRRSHVHASIGPHLAAGASGNFSFSWLREWRVPVRQAFRTSIPSATLLQSAEGQLPSNREPGNRLHEGIDMGRCWTSVYLSQSVEKFFFNVEYGIANRRVWKS